MYIRTLRRTTSSMDGTRNQPTHVILTRSNRLQVVPASPSFTEWQEIAGGEAIQMTPLAGGAHRLLYWAVPCSTWTRVLGRISATSGRVGISARTQQDGAAAVDVVLDISADGQSATPSVCVGSSCTVIGTGNVYLRVFFFTRWYYSCI